MFKDVSGRYESRLVAAAEGKAVNGESEGRLSIISGHEAMPDDGRPMIAKKSRMCTPA